MDVMGVMGVMAVMGVLEVMWIGYSGLHMIGMWVCTGVYERAQTETTV